MGTGLTSRWERRAGTCLCVFFPPLLAGWYWMWIEARHIFFFPPPQQVSRISCSMTVEVAGGRLENGCGKCGSRGVSEWVSECCEIGFSTDSGSVGGYKLGWKLMYWGGVLL